MDLLRSTIATSMTMRGRQAGTLAVLAACVIGCGGERDVATADAGADEPDAGEPSALDVLWIGAHPDDEMMVAAVLGADCVDGARACGLLVMTAGEAGNCARTALCSGEDLATLRRRELEASASLFGARLEQWDLGDGTTGDARVVLEAWASRAGGAEALLARMVDALRRLRPDRVYTFDPRHGSTCHPDHRATGALVILAARALGDDAPEIELVASTPDSADPSAVGFAPAAADDPALVRFDATVRLASIGGEAWLYGVRVLELHATQFDDTVLDAFRSARADQRASYFVPLAAAREDDPLYTGFCAR